MGTTILLAILALLYKLNTDTDSRWWYCFVGGLAIVTSLGWRSTLLSLLLVTGLFKVIKDLCTGCR